MRIRTVLAAVGLATAGLFAGASGASAYGVPSGFVHGEYAAHGKYIEMGEEELEIGTYSVEALIHGEIGKHRR
ncbi:hypothetical protein [Streptomyces sp. NBC_01803]|uniref:hypothetical protein n=1 Tax=Streptomyces sp. NBC_01803 TaxID=2975946 RepID=UPI002DD82679|nr:hypothetical protein [Streptomyces sp. NBC_01803]WSA44721.1 hypothetical protein OIE51_11205 [Streptomyces sp. NBC_01803]